MDALEARVRAAGESRPALDELVRDYLPFVKKQAALAAPGLDYDDRLSLSMLAFANAVRRYEPGRGAFLPFAETCIRNRLADEVRRERRYAEKITPLDEVALAAPDELDRELERESLSAEIQRLDQALAPLGVAFSELPKVCPRQGRARSQCLAMAACVAADAGLNAAFRRTGRLPQSELAARFGVSVKTIEKHRKYIVALVTLLLGDYPGIRAFLPGGEAKP